VRLAIRAVETFGDVEDDIGASGAESFREFFGRLEGITSPNAESAVATAAIVSAESHSA
jgi:hypothetical protein